MGSYCFDGACSEDKWEDVYGFSVVARRTAWKWPWDAYQVFSWALVFLVTAILFAAQIPFLQGVVFWVCFPLSTLLIVLLVGFKLFLECFPPHDPVVFEKGDRLSRLELLSAPPPAGTHPCFFCRRFVQNHCTHCMQCGKCILGFDHHCRWINHCIGAVNYKAFFIFLILTLLSSCWEVATAIYVLVTALSDVGGFKRRMEQQTYHCSSSLFGWIMAISVLGAVICMCAIFSLGRLLIFHIRLLHAGLRTCDIVKRHHERLLNSNSAEPVLETPESMRRLREELGPSDGGSDMYLFSIGDIHLGATPSSHMDG